jgi:hypothetical protein
MKAKHPAGPPMTLGVVLRCSIQASANLHAKIALANYTIVSLVRMSDAVLKLVVPRWEQRCHTECPFRCICPAAWSVPHPLADLELAKHRFSGRRDIT